MRSSGSLEARLFPEVRPSVRFSRVSLKKRNRSIDESLLELPQILDWLAFATTNGVGLYQAISLVSQRAEGKVASALAKLCRELEYGASFEVALQNLANDSKSLTEFSNRLALTLRRGTPVAQQLRALAQSSRASLRNQLLARAGANEVKLLLPLVFLILPVTVWFAIFPSLQLLQLGI